MRLGWLLFLAAMLVACAASPDDDEWPDPEGIPYQDLPSPIVGDTFRIYETLPDAYDEDPTRRWPLLVYLDGDWTAGTIRALHLPVVAIGVGYPELNHRDRDYLYPTSSLEPEAGGAAVFNQFLRDELVPWADARYRTDPAMGRTLAGHSYGGFFTMFALFQASSAFDGFVAASPAQWYGRGYLFEAEADRANGPRQLPVSLFISIGENEGVEMNAPFDEMVARLGSRAYEGLRLHGVRYPDVGHDPTMRMTFRDALPFVLDRP